MLKQLMLITCSILLVSSLSFAESLSTTGTYSNGISVQTEDGNGDYSLNGSNPQGTDGNGGTQSGSVDFGAPGSDNNGDTDNSTPIWPFPDFNPALYSFCSLTYPAFIDAVALVQFCIAYFDSCEEPGLALSFVNDETTVVGSQSPAECGELVTAAKQISATLEDDIKEGEETNLPGNPDGDNSAQCLTTDTTQCQGSNSEGPGMELPMS